MKSRSVEDYLEVLLETYIKYPDEEDAKEAKAHFLLRIYNNERESWKRILKTPLNPFKAVNIKKNQSILIRTYEVFAGSNYTMERESLAEAAVVKEIPFWKVPPQQKRGVFGYLLGLPMQAVYFFLPSALALLTMMVLSAIIVDGLLEYLSKLKNPLAKWTAGILLSPLLVGSAGLALAGFAGFIVSKAALYPINWLVQRAVIPGLSLLAVALVSPIVGIVHGIFNSPQKKLPRQETAFKSTHSVVSQNIPTSCNPGKIYQQPQQNIQEAQDQSGKISQLPYPESAANPQPQAQFRR